MNSDEDVNEDDGEEPLDLLLKALDQATASVVDISTGQTIPLAEALKTAMSEDTVVLDVPPSTNGILCK